MAKDKKSVVLLSGGLDSTVAFKWAIDNSEVLLALTFDYGQKARNAELRASSAMASGFGKPHKIIELPWLKKITSTALVDKDGIVPEPDAASLDDKAKGLCSAKSVWVPNRNAVFINIAASCAEALGADQVIAGFNSEEAATFPDNSAEYVRAATNALSFSTLNGVKVVSPTIDMNKSEIVSLGLEICAPLDMVWSCYLDGERMCGKCESCMRLKRALGSKNKGLASLLFPHISV